MLIPVVPTVLVVDVHDVLACEGVRTLDGLLEFDILLEPDEADLVDFEAGRLEGLVDLMHLLLGAEVKEVAALVEVVVHPLGQGDDRGSRPASVVRALVHIPRWVDDADVERELGVGVLGLVDEVVDGALDKDVAGFDVRGGSRQLLAAGLQHLPHIVEVNLRGKNVVSGGLGGSCGCLARLVGCLQVLPGGARDQVI